MKKFKEFKEFNLEEEIERIIGYVMDDNYSTLEEDLRQLYNEGYGAGWDAGKQD